MGHRTMPAHPETFFDVEVWFKDEERSIAFVALTGVGAHVVNTKSDVTYEVIAGAAYFNIDGTVADPFDSAVFQVLAGNSIEIPKGTPYQDYGDAAMLATCVPGFDPRDVVLLSRPE